MEEWKMKKCIKYVEALDRKEVKQILIFNKNNLPCVVVEPNITQQFSENFLWKDDQKAMEGVKEAYSGPYQFLVLFFKKENGGI